MHYRAAARDDTAYWKEANTREIPDGLASKLEIASSHLLDDETIYEHYHGFEAYSWNTMLLGLGWEPKQPRPALSMIEPSRALSEFDRIQTQAKQAVASLPTCYDYLVTVME
jgi:Tryptophan halogenase